MGVVDLNYISFFLFYTSRLNVAMINPGAYNYSTLFYDFDTGLTVPKFVNPPNAAVFAAMTEYINILEANYSYLQEGYYLPDPIPEELLIPYGKFVDRHNLSAAVQLVNQIVQNDGNIWKVPTVQMLKAIDITLAQAALEGFLVVASGDTQDIYTSAAQVLGQDVLYSSTATHMDRNSSSGVAIITSTPSGPKLVLAKHLVVTIPPILSSLASSFDLSSAETSVFGKFKARGYYGAVIEHHGINDTFYTNIGTNTPFNLQVLPGIFTIQPTGIPNQHAVYFGSLDPSVSNETVKQTITQQITALQDHGVFAADTPEFLYFTNHSPFRLYVHTNEIKNGFYRDLYDLQGQSNTFWTGAAWSTQDSSQIWNFTEYQVLPRIIASLQ